ncbi:MAG: TldD/PmbA family protein [Porphyromonadaceae bacterium]|nr:TldD/PmbA family protein [Porphyromonadaceae bacterium]
MKDFDVPVYYISLNVEQSIVHSISGGYGAISDNRYYKGRRMLISMRVGSNKFDNLHYSGNMNNHIVVTLPEEDVEEEIKLTLWRGLQQAYSEAKDKLESNLTEFTTRPTEEDQSPDFSIEEASQYFEPPMQFEELEFNESETIANINSITKMLGDNRDILINFANFHISLSRQYFLDTDGALIVQNSPSVRLYSGGMVMADDGMVLQDYLMYFGRKVSDLADIATILQDTEEMSQTLTALKNSPKIDSYTGPVILGGEVSGVFFHEFLGHRVEGARMKSGFDAQTLKKKIGEYVLPKRLSVTFDPTMTEYNNTILSGDYKFDDEGIRGQRVEVIKNGILKNFLMSRTPIEGFSKSNGHGRGNLNIGTETRQSNMIIESSNPVSIEKLNKTFKDELKKKGLKFGYRIDKVSGGLTMTSSATANAFYLSPLVVYRVYADGRPDELVRGINIVGTPLAAFSQIIAESNDQQIFNGMCGALSGSVPVSAIAPTMLVKELEFQKTGDNQKIEPYIMERP